MPTYSYKCKECEHQFDVWQSMSDDKLTDCPECAKKSLEKVITATGGFHLKGDGWFNTGGY